MSLILILTAILVGPALIARLAALIDPRFDIGWHTPAKIGVTLLFLLACAGHFVTTAAMVRMLPPWVPRRTEIVYITGVLELLGAIGIWIPHVAKTAAVCLVLLIIAVFPANVYTALNHLPIAGHENGIWYLLVRVPFEVFIIIWTYKATRQTWFSRVWHKRT